MPYKSSLTDAEWDVLEPLLVEILPQKKRTRPTNWTTRELLDGLFYQLKNGCNWEDLPKDLPPYSTVYWHYKKWREAGAIEPLMNALHVKNTCNASVASKGVCFYKETNGIKRHLAVDSLGFPFFTHCTSANLSDDAGLVEMLIHNIAYFRAKPMNIPKITLLLDHAYHPDHLTQELERVYPQIMKKIKFELSTKPSKQEKAA